MQANAGSTACRCGRAQQHVDAAGIDVGVKSRHVANTTVRGSCSSSLRIGMHVARIETGGCWLQNLGKTLYEPWVARTSDLARTLPFCCLMLARGKAVSS